MLILGELSSSKDLNCSRSSSTTSLEKIGAFVTSLNFINCYAKKGCMYKFNLKSSFMNKKKP